MSITAGAFHAEPKIHLGGDTRYGRLAKKNGGRVEGQVYNAAAGVEWMAARNVALVLDYGIQKIDLHRNGERTADLDLKLTGPSAYLKVRF